MSCRPRWAMNQPSRFRRATTLRVLVSGFSTMCIYMRNGKAVQGGEAVAATRLVARRDAPKKQCANWRFETAAIGEISTRVADRQLAVWQKMSPQKWMAQLSYPSPTAPR